MKLSSILIALVATISSAQPVDEQPPALVGFDWPAEIQEHNSTQLQERGAEIADYNLYESPYCAGGYHYFRPTAPGNPSKFTFSTPQKSIRIYKVTNGFHITMYTGKDQSGLKNQFSTANVGQCWTLTDTTIEGWWSTGVYAN